MLNRAKIDPQEPLMPILLHEVTHAVDPYFEEDHRRLNPPGGPARQLTSEEQYDLPSEQRAFPAMWTADLQDRLAQRALPGVGAIMPIYRRHPDFGGFLRYAEAHRPDLYDQTRAHLRIIVEDLKTRQ